MSAPAAEEERLDLHDLIVDLCARLELEPAHVGEIVLTPGELIATVYELDESGHKFIRDDDRAATREVRRKIRS